MQQQAVTVSFTLVLSESEIAAIYATGSPDAMAQALIHHLDQAEMHNRVLKLFAPYSARQDDQKKLQHRINYTRTHQDKIDGHHRSLQAVLKSPLYAYATHHAPPTPARVMMWLNRKAKPMHHFPSNMWGVAPRSAEWAVANPRRVVIEDFKLALTDGPYHKLLDHASTYFQKSYYGGVVDYSRLFMVARAYDEDDSAKYDGRRFSSEMLAEFSRTCLEHDLRVVIDDRVYRGAQCRFLLIADCNVDLEQAYAFALTLPVR
jgi:hypothetical protein